MRKFVRVETPAILAEKWEEWGREWEERRRVTANAEFHWHKVDKVPVNQMILPELKRQFQEHCSFCDNYPISPPSIDTIEHFRPKTKYHREAYQWENLYYCCAFCQRKGAGFDDALLRPDAEDYTFERYFRCDYTTGNIEVNEQATAEDQNRARTTLRLYDLNNGHPSLRKRELYQRRKMPDHALDDFAYRDFVGSPVSPIVNL
jgi:uncharacterized protein (TIGR02646 family)